MEENTIVEGHVASEAIKPDDILLGNDGKYRWYYEYKLLKNPTIIKLLWKIFLLVIVLIWAFVCVLDIIEGHLTLKGWLNMSKVFLIVLAGVEVLVAIGYFVYAAIMKFKYCVIFEMDDKGVVHTQLNNQFQKAQAASMVTVLAGLATGSPGVAGSGLLAATKQSLSTNWSKVRRCEINRRREVIKLSGLFNKNQVYVTLPDFAFVESFVRSHLPSRCKIHVKGKPI